MQHRRKDASSEPRSYNTPKEQVAERLNLTESNRLDYETKFYTRMKHTAEHSMNMRINRVQESLEQIALSTGNLSGFHFFNEEDMAPCFMYGERVESRRRYSKRMALLRFFLERRPKSPQSGMVCSSSSWLKNEGCIRDTRSGDEIFEEILNKIETDSDTEDENEEGDDENVMKSAGNLKPILTRRTSAVSYAVGNVGKCRLPSGKDTKRPKTAPSWQSRRPQSPVSPVSKSAWELSRSTEHKLSSSSSQKLKFHVDSDCLGHHKSDSQPNVYSPFLADFNPVNRNNFRSVRKTHSATSSSGCRSAQGSSHLSHRETVSQQSTSSISSRGCNPDSVRMRTPPNTSPLARCVSPNRNLPEIEAARIDRFISTNGRRYDDNSDTFMLPSLLSGRKELHHPFKRPSVYAPTIASRQRTLSSMLVSAGKKKHGSAL